MFYKNTRFELTVIAATIHAMLSMPAQAGDLEAQPGKSELPKAGTGAVDVVQPASTSSTGETQSGATTPTLVTEESGRAFLERYFAAIGTAKSVSDLSQFYDDADMIEKDSKSDPMVHKALEDFALLCIKQEPIKVKVLSETKEPSGGLRFSLVPAVIPKDYESASKQPGFSMTGSVVLIRKGDSWKVHKDYWVVKTKGFGTAVTSFGKDPDGDHEKEQKASAPPTRTSFRDPEDDYQDKFRRRFMDDWNAPGSGKVHASFKVSANGAIGAVSVKDKNHSKSAEDYVRQRITSMKTVGTLPPGFRNKPNVWMYFDWSKDANAVSGPYFDEQLPDFVSYDLGIKVKPYDSIMVDKLMGALAKQAGSGSAIVFLKLKQNGAIEKIFVKTDPPNPTYERAAYAVVGRAHPFGPLPAGVMKNPYFRCWVNWGSSAGASAEQLDDPPKWLR